MFKEDGKNTNKAKYWKLVYKLCKPVFCIMVPHIFMPGCFSLYKISCMQTLFNELPKNLNLKFYCFGPQNSSCLPHTMGGLNDSALFMWHQLDSVHCHI